MNYDWARTPDATRESMLTRIWIIATNTFREAVRDRILYNLVVFALLIIAASVLIGDLSGGQETRIITNLGLAATFIFGISIAIFVGVSLISKEIDKRTVFAIFAKPVGRGEFIIGRFFGLVATLLLNIAVMGCGVIAVSMVIGDGSLTRGIAQASLMIFFEVTVVTAIAVLFSSFSSPALSALLSFLIVVIGHFSGTLAMIAERTSDGFSRTLLYGIYYLFPNLSNFTFISEVAGGRDVPVSMMLNGLLYAASYSAAMVAIAVMIFRRRNFK